MAKVNLWENRLRLILNELAPNKSQRHFALSCWNCIERSPETFPTRAQAVILDRIWRHLCRVKAEEEQMRLLEAEDKV